MASPNKNPHLKTANQQQTMNVQIFQLLSYLVHTKFCGQGSDSKDSAKTVWAHHQIQLSHKGALVGFLFD